jgi:hypothetical protein
MRFLLWMVNFAVLAAVGIVIFNRDKESAEANANPVPTNVVTTSQPSQPSQPINEPVLTAPPPPAPAATTTNAPPAKNAITPSVKPPIRTNSVPIKVVKIVTNTAPTPLVTPAPGAVNPNIPVPKSAIPPAPMTNSVATNLATTSMTNAPGILTTNGFRIAGLAIERPRGTKGSKLTYVTGLAQNIETRKRFGVRIELNLLDRGRNRVGVATDYSAVIEPMGSWRFRALVLDRRAVLVSLAGIRED